MDWAVVVEVVSKFLMDVVIPIVAAVAGAYLAKWLKARGIVVQEEASRRKLEEVMQAVVGWAEQRYGDEAGAYRRAQARELLKQMGYDPNAPEVEAQLEATVEDMNFHFRLREERAGGDG